MASEPSSTIYRMKSNDSLQNYLHVTHPITLTWQEISMFVKNSWSASSHQCESCSSTPDTPCRQEAHVEASTASDVDNMEKRLGIEKNLAAGSGWNCQPFQTPCHGQETATTSTAQDSVAGNEAYAGEITVMTGVDECCTDLGQSNNSENPRPNKISTGLDEVYTEGITETHTDENEAFTGKDEVKTHTKFFFEVKYDFPSDSDIETKPSQSPPGRETWDRSKKEDMICHLMERTRRSSTQWKRILKGVVGMAEQGTLLAVLGASGSGKTALLKVLAGRSIAGSHVSGTVRANGVPVKGRIQQLCAYVPRDRVFLANLTVKETLAFRASLELTNSNERERASILMDILNDLKLTKAADTLVGSPDTKKGISGGERKRLAMACELLSNRPLVLCDDPTWDLDPATARDTLRALRTLADRQHTVICSVLHPSSWSWSWSWWWWWWWTSSQAHVFSCFHKVLLLMEGHTAFMGTSSEALAFFSSLGHVNPQHLNPADFLLETPTLTTPLMAKAISEAFLKTSYAQEMLTCIQTLTRDGVTQTHEIQQMLLSSVRRPASWWEQVKGNVWRFWTVGKRERRWLFFNCFATSLFVGFLFLRLDWTGYTQSHVLNVNGALFLITSVVCCTTTHTFVSVFPGWVPIVLRDHHDRLYRLDVFYLTAVLMGLPWMLRVPLFTISVDYWIVGLVRHTSNFLTAVGICCLAASVSMAFGLAVSTVTGGEVRVAAWWSNAITFPLLLVSGFLVNVGSIPDWLQWLGFVSWFRHTNELLMVNQWNEVERIACRSDGNGSGCLFQEGAEVLRYFHLGSENCLRNYVSLVVLSVVFHALAFVALCFRAPLPPHPPPTPLSPIGFI